MALVEFSKWLKRKPAGPKPRRRLTRTQVRRVSKKRRKESAEYMAKRKAFLLAHPVCQLSTPRTDIIEGCRAKATDIHHVRGRTGANYLNAGTWMSACRDCHRWVHDHPGQARAIGLLK